MCTLSVRRIRVVSVYLLITILLPTIIPFLIVVWYSHYLLCGASKKKGDAFELHTVLYFFTPPHPFIIIPLFPTSQPSPVLPSSFHPIALLPPFFPLHQSPILPESLFGPHEPLRTGQQRISSYLFVIYGPKFTCWGTKSHDMNVLQALLFWAHEHESIPGWVTNRNLALY